MTRTSGSLVIALAGLVAAAQAGEPMDTVLKFGGPDYKCLSPSAPWVYQKGESWVQTFRSTGVASTDRLALTLHFTNSLGAGAKLDLDVHLNDKVIGSISIPQGTASPQTYRFSFPTLGGPDYTIKL